MPSQKGPKELIPNNAAASNIGYTLKMLRT